MSVSPSSEDKDVQEEVFGFRGVRVLVMMKLKQKRELFPLKVCPQILLFCPERKVYKRGTSLDI